MHPVNGPVSQEFGARPDFAWQLGYGHLGIDYAVPEGTPIRAIADCTILWADWCINMPASFANANMFIPGTEGGGKTIVAQNDGYRAIYAHLSSFAVRSGDRVKRGDVIGHSGWTGNVVPRNANGAHLHFEVYTYPCSGMPPYSRYNPRDQIAEEDRIDSGTVNIVPAGNIKPTPKEGFLMALTDQEQKDLYKWMKETRDRTIGGIPAGAARDASSAGTTPRLADSGDIWDIKQRLKSTLDTSGGDVLLRAVYDASGKTTNELKSFGQATEDVTRQYLAERVTEGAKPGEVADAVIAAMGTDLASQVISEIGNRLAKEGGK